MKLSLLPCDRITAASILLGWKISPSNILHLVSALLLVDALMIKSASIGHRSTRYGQLCCKARVDQSCCVNIF